MRIKSLSLNNFRNFVNVQDLEFPEAPLLIAAAPNATGKTNFLESLAVLLRGKSFRSPTDECVGWGEDYFLIQGVATQNEEDCYLSVQYHKPTRKLRIEEGGIPVSPVTFYARYPYVLFLPEDTFLFHRGPAVRRNFLNTALVSSSQYLSAVVQYHRTLRQRNAALKHAHTSDDIGVWTGMLAEAAGLVWAQRQAFADYIKGQITALYAGLFQEEHSISMEFVPGAADPASYAAILEESWQYEKRYGYTLYGPHRDDFQIFVNGRPAAAALSRGQMRSLVIALKVGTFQFIKQLTGQVPLILFDEVLSELDESRQKALLEHLPAAQTILTCTRVPEGVRDSEGVYMLDLEKVMKKSVPGRDGGAVKVVSEEKEEAQVEVATEAARA